MTNALGSVTDTYTYDVYGLTIAATGSTPNSYLYPGEQTGTNLRLQYLRARYYNPSSGRFASTDPFVRNTRFSHIQTVMHGVTLILISVLLGDFG